MNNSEDRVRRLDVAGAQSPTLRPRNPSRARARRRARRRMGAARATPWSTVVNNCAQDGKIRRDALIALAMVLLAVVVIVCVVFGVLGPQIRDAAGNDIIRAVAGSVLGGGGLACGGLWLRRRRARRVGPAPDPDAEPRDPSGR